MLRSAIYGHRIGLVFLVFFAISLGRMVIPSPKIVTNLPRTYEAIPYEEEPYRFRG